MSEHRGEQPDRTQAFVVGAWQLRRRRALHEHAQLVHDLRILVLEHDQGDIDGTTFLSEVGRLGRRAERLYLDGWRWAA